jgi:peptidoglycan/xylan/chitin deacetylase (PgdA/CDA1 family)
MSYLNHVLVTKGFVHSFERSAQILRRFFRGKSMFNRMITNLERDFGDQQAKITFCVTASLLNGNLRLFEKLRGMGHDIAAHGYVHTDMSRKTRKEQIEIIRRSYGTFYQHRIPISGFRCPYLSHNNDTLDIIKLSAFKWTSNRMVLWGDLVNHRRPFNGAMEKIGRLYNIEDASQTLVLPRIDGNLIEIPISGPDDEMLFERLRVKNKKKMGNIWFKMLQETHERGELFHLLFHPERFRYIKDIMKEIISRSANLNPPVWIASLKEITDWWKEKEAFQWHQEEVRAGAWRTWVQVPRGATMLMKASVNGGKGFYRDYEKILPAEERDNTSSFICTDEMKGTVSISPNSTREMENFLTGEGFIVERTTGPQNGSLFIDGNSNFTDQDKRSLLDTIDCSPFPVLRMWRWPNGTRSAITISADVDGVTLMDFVKRALSF